MIRWKGTTLLGEFPVAQITDEQVLELMAEALLMYDPATGGFMSDPPTGEAAAPRLPSPWHNFINGVCECGVRRETLRGIDHSWIGKTKCPPEAANDGIAHSGCLNPAEADYIVWLNQIEANNIGKVMGWT